MLKTCFVILLSCSLFAGGRLIESETNSRLTIKHREYEGVGYDTGYSSAELFLAPVWRHEFLPFLDVRVHVLNNGHFAFNGGVGIRAPATDEWTVGGHLIYDFRDTSEFNPHQISGGLEALSDRIDLRFDVYWPVNNTDFFMRKLVSIQGNTALVQEMAGAALPVLEGEVGVPIFERCDDIFLYLAAGPYYLFSRDIEDFDFGKSAGGRARFSTTFFRMLQLEVSCTYDSIFKTNVQGMVALHFPLGPRNLGKNSDVLCDPMTQSLIRNEIIPIEKKERVRTLLLQ